MGHRKGQDGLDAADDAAPQPQLPHDRHPSGASWRASVVYICCIGRPMQFAHMLMQTVASTSIWSFGSLTNAGDVGPPCWHQGH